MSLLTVLMKSGYTIICLVFIIFLLNSCFVPGEENPQEEGNVKNKKWLMGYYVGYHSSIYPPESISFKYLTHIALGAVVPNINGTLNTSFYLSPENGITLAKNISNLANAAGVKRILMIGGAGAHQNWVGAASNANRSNFIQNLLKTMDDLGYDGLDLDWEPILESDEPLLKNLITELRQLRPDIILTLPVNWINNNFPQIRPFFSQVEPHLDQINIMSYSMVWEGDGWKSWHSSALRGETPSTPSSVNSSVQAYLSSGIPPEKIGVGIGFFGVGWAGVDGPGQEMNNSPHFVASDNHLSYTNIMSKYYEQSLAKWDDTAKVPYLSSLAGFGPLSCNFLSYEDEKSIKEKGDFILEKSLGGAIIWTIDQGYIANSNDGEPDPLLRAISECIWE